MVGDIIFNLMAHIYKSSFRFNTLNSFTSQDFRKGKHIINHILENPESFEFRQPVNWQALSLLDYPQIIKNPMDLGTIRSKLQGEVYLNIQQFLDDFELIWDNCKTYNIKGTWIYSLADKLQKNGKKMLKNYFPHIPLQSLKTMNLATSQPTKLPQSKPKKQQVKYQRNDKLYYQDEEEITIHQKMRLADKFKELKPEQNKEVVQYIQSVCPTAFRQLDTQVQIVVDNMDIITFKQIMGKIEEIEGERVEEMTKKIKIEDIL